MTQISIEFWEFVRDERRYDKNVFYKGAVDIPGADERRQWTRDSWAHAVVNSRVQPLINVTTCVINQHLYIANQWPIICSKYNRIFDLQIQSQLIIKRIFK